MNKIGGDLKEIWLELTLYTSQIRSRSWRRLPDSWKTILIQTLACLDVHLSNYGNNNGNVTATDIFSVWFCNRAPYFVWIATWFRVISDEFLQVVKNFTDLWKIPMEFWWHCVNIQMYFLWFCTWTYIVHCFVWLCWHSSVYKTFSCAEL